MFQATEPEETWEQTKADSAVLSAGLWTGATSWTLETRQCNKGKWGARGRGAPSPPEPVSAFWEEATEEGPLAPDPRLRLSLAAWGTLQEAGLCSWLPEGLCRRPGSAPGCLGDSAGAPGLGSLYSLASPPPSADCAQLH